MASVIRIHKTGGPEVLQVDGVDIGAPGRGELRLPMTKEKMIAAQRRRTPKPDRSPRRCPSDRV